MDYLIRLLTPLQNNKWLLVSAIVFVSLLLRLCQSAPLEQVTLILQFCLLWQCICITSITWMLLKQHWMCYSHNIDGLVQDCGISIATALEILQYCTKPSICNTIIVFFYLSDRNYHTKSKCDWNMTRKTSRPELLFYLSQHVLNRGRYMCYSCKVTPLATRGKFVAERSVWCLH